MPKILEEPVEKIQVHLFTRDLVELRAMASKDAPVNKIIRHAIRAFLNASGATVRAAIDKAETQMGSETRG